MFKCPAFAGVGLLLVGLSAANIVHAQLPAASAGAAKPDSAALHCALGQYIPWVRAQPKPLDPDLKAKRLRDIDEACGTSLHLSNIVTADDPAAGVTDVSQQPTTRVLPPTPVPPSLPALVRALHEDLQKPEYFESRCMLAPMFASDKRFIAMSRDDRFHPGDRILRINGEILNPDSVRAAHDLLIRYPPDATVTVRVSRSGNEVDVTTACLDNKAYYALLRAAVDAATQDDAVTCTDKMREAGKMHALSSTWLNVSLNCESRAGWISGPTLLAEYFVIYQELLMENNYSEAAIQKIRPALQEAAQKLANANSLALAEKLQEIYGQELSKWPALQSGALALQLPPPPALRQIDVTQPPRALVSQNGNVTNITMPGQLAANNPLGCVPLQSLDNTHAPPEIYLGVTACIQKDDYRSGATLFALAGVESRFDAARVLDKSAGQAGQVLIMSTFGGLQQDKRDKFEHTVVELAADPNAMTETCTTIRKIGFPRYHPAYMILHGINAFTARPGDATLEPNFDAESTWDSLMTGYLNCHDAKGARPVAAVPAKPLQTIDAYRMKPGFYEVKTRGGILDGADSGNTPTTLHLCFTQAMIDKSNPLSSLLGSCIPKITHHGNETRTEISCVKDGATITGSSLETVNGNKRTLAADVATAAASASHSIHIDAEFTYLGADCTALDGTPATP